jgi:hypothetical protein
MRRKFREAATGTRIGCIVFGAFCLILGAITHRFRGDIRFQDELSTPLGCSLLGGVALGTMGSLVLWNRAEARRPFLWAVLATGVVDVAVIVAAVRGGWLGGTAFRPPMLVQLLVYAPGLLCLVAVPLAIYRWLAARSASAAALVYLAIVAAFSAVSVPVEENFIARGVYVFGRGYSVQWDVAWGAAQFAFALAVYRVLVARRRRIGEPRS